MAERQTLIHVHSGEQNKVPQVGKLMQGEIAVNTFPGIERLYIENSTGVIIPFIPEHEVKRLIAASSGGSGGSDPFYSGSGTVTQAKAGGAVNIPVDKHSVIVELKGGGSLKITGADTLGDGRDVQVVMHNGGASVASVMVPDGPKFINVLGKPSLDIQPDSYSEMNILRLGASYYVRAV